VKTATHYLWINNLI